MTPEIEKKRRELFEAVYPLPVGMYWLESENQYAGHVQFWLWTDRFNAFNAALDAVEIELPKGESNMTAGALHMIARCNKAITATCLGLRIK